MTLAQLRYVITVSQVGTLSEAAKRLYISQPSLTNAIKELEKEKDKFSMNTKLKINNTIKDVKITVQVIYDGEEALGVLGDIEIL